MDDKLIVHVELGAGIGDDRDEVRLEYAHDAVFDAGRVAERSENVENAPDAQFAARSDHCVSLQGAGPGQKERRCPVR